MRLSGRSGFGLMILVMLIGVTGTLLASSSWFLVQEMRRTQLRIDQMKAHYLAQAAVMRAVWNWYTANTTVEGSRRWNTVNTTMTGNNIFKAGLTSAGVYLQSNYAYVAPTNHTGITHIAALGTAQSKALGTTLVRTLAAGVAQGDLIVVYFAMDNAAGAVTCADSAGAANPYSVAADVTNASGVRTVILYAIANTALVATNTITVTHPNVTARAMCVRQFRGPTTLDNTATATGATNAPNSGTAARAERHELLVGANGMEGPSGDLFTQGAGWTDATKLGTTGGVADTNVTIFPQYRIQNDATAYAAGGTNTTSARDWASAVAAFYGGAHWYTPPATSNRRLRAWQIQNVNTTAGNNITATHMKVSWTGGGAAQLTEIRLNNTAVWSGAGASGTTFDITDTAITAAGGTLTGINTYLQWDNSGPADPVTVTIQITFSGDSATTDAKSHEIRLWEGCQTVANCDGLGTVLGRPGERTFQVTGTGQVNQTTDKYFKVMKTVKAVISGKPGLNTFEIVDWDEGDKNIP